MKPFLKWAGSKASLVPELLKWVPRGYKTYHEPFMGSAALFFALQPARAILSDANATLVRTFRAVQQDPHGVCTALGEHTRQHCKTWYDSMRALNPDAAPNTRDVAAWLIYLNKTCHNGLFRVNKSGRFNVPMGAMASGKPPTILDAPTIFACSRALFGHPILHADFRLVEARVAPDDFVYFDSPYAPITEGSFTSYTADGFTDKDQAELADLALRLKRRGVHVLLSNSPTVRPLYEKDFEIRVITRAGSMNSKGSERGRVEELLIR